MARYIDANVLKEKILEERDKIPLTLVQCYSFGVETPYREGQARRGGIRKALRCLEQTPTADVAPKSEVDQLKATIERLEQEKAEMLVSATTDIPITMETLFKVRTEHPIFKAIESEVAREIFEEIEKAVAKGFEYGTFFDVQKNIAELKKKYTGEQT